MIHSTYRRTVYRARDAQETRAASREFCRSVDELAAQIPDLSALNDTPFDGDDFNAEAFVEGVCG